MFLYRILWLLFCVPQRISTNKQKLTKNTKFVEENSTKDFQICVVELFPSGFWIVVAAFSQHVSCMMKILFRLIYLFIINFLLKCDPGSTYEDICTDVSFTHNFQD